MPTVQKKTTRPIFIVIFALQLLCHSVITVVYRERQVCRGKGGCCGKMLYNMT